VAVYDVLELITAVTVAVILCRPTIGVARIVSTLSYMVIYIIYCHQLPFYLICRGAPHQIHPQFCLIATKMPRKKFLL